MAANEYTIEADEHHIWRAHWKNHPDYPLGQDRKRAEAVMKRLASAAHPTILVSGGDLIACLHEHSAEGACEYVTLIPHAEA